MPIKNLLSRVQFGGAGGGLRVEAFSVVALLAITTYFSVLLGGLRLFDVEDASFIRYFVIFSPVLLVYIFVRFLFPPIVSCVLVIFIFLLLLGANTIKQSLTGQPLSWQDVAFANNISVIIHYIDFIHVAIIFLAAVFLVIGRGKFSRGISVWFMFPLFIVVAIFCFHQYFEGSKNKYARQLYIAICQAGLEYSPWDWQGNISRSGLALHLVQTGFINKIKNPSSLDRLSFSRLIDVPPDNKFRPKNIVVIVCESCWHNDKYFYDAFFPLKKLGLSSFRAISPIYGGLTANAEFELVTGLPARGALNGVIYQEYASAFRDSTFAYPERLRESGYKTIAAHNHYSKFWRRDIVLPKLGFERFISLENMRYNGKIWADDGVLFDSVINEMRASGGGFYFLTTAFTHGPYDESNDSGESDYFSRLSLSISLAASFIRGVIEAEPNSLIILVGDHKPTLNRFFLDMGVVKKRDFMVIGADNKSFKLDPAYDKVGLGDVPVYFYPPYGKVGDDLIDALEGRPLFCLLNTIDEKFIGVGAPGFLYARKNNICDGGASYDESVSAFPDYMYALSLF